MIEVRWHGRGGQGGWTVARLLGMAVTQFGDKYALSFPSFGPERRGAPVLGFTKIDNKKILDRSEVKDCDYVVVLDETLLNEETSRGLRPGGTLIVNSRENQKIAKLFPGFRIVTIDASRIAHDILGKPITNTAMLGALLAVSGITGLETVSNTIKYEMKSSLVEKNIAVVKRAYDEAMETKNG